MVIKANTIIEIVGTPKDHIEKTMDKVIELISKNKEFKLTKHSKAEVKETETKEMKNLWSTFTEFEIDFPNLDSITGFCFEFMPSSLEILEPDNLTLESREIEHALNDVLARIHQYDMILKRYALMERAAAKQKQG